MITQLIELLKFNIKAQHNHAYMDKTQRGKGIRVKGVLGWKVGKGGEKGGRKKTQLLAGAGGKEKQTKVKIKSHI